MRPSTWVKGGGQDKNAQEKWQVQDVLGTYPRCFWSFLRCLWPGEKNDRKCASGVDLLKGLLLQKRGFDCIFAVFYCFLLKSTSFDIRHAKCDLTVKNLWEMRTGRILPRAAFCQNWVLTCDLHGFVFFPSNRCLFRSKFTTR